MCWAPQKSTLACWARTLGYVPGKETSSIQEKDGLENHDREQKSLQGRVFIIQGGILQQFQGTGVGEAGAISLSCP